MTQLIKFTQYCEKIRFCLSQHILVLVRSPSTIKSPGKDYGINERIETSREKLIQTSERWNLADSNGLQCINIIHNLKEKSSDNPYPAELEVYCKKLVVVKTVFEDVIKAAAAFRKEMVGSIAILESMKDNEDLKAKLNTIKNFLDVLIELYESSLQMKQFIIGKIECAY